MRSNIMKLFLFLICFFVFVTNEGNAQRGRWVKVDSVRVKYRPSDDGYLANRFMAIDCYDSLNCIAAANVGLTIPLFRATSDGGKTWETVFYDSIIENPIDSSIIYRPPKVANISYPGRNLCVAVADTDYYYYSNDGLKTWKKGQLDAYRNSSLGLYQKVDFFNEKIGLIKIVNYLFLTTDGCDSWTQLHFDLPDSIKPDDIASIQILSENDIIIIAAKLIDNKWNTYVLKSYDLGKTWKAMPFTPMSMKIFFLDDLIAFGVSSVPDTDIPSKRKEFIFQSTDGGFSWMKKLDTLVSQNQGWQKIIFYDRLNGAALGNWFKLLRTTDGGVNWFRDTSYNNKNMFDYFKDIVFLDSKTLLGVSNQDKYIYKYTEEPLSVTVDNTFEPDVSVFPNPSEGLFTLNFNLSQPSGIRIQVFNLFGTLAYESPNELYPGGEHKIEMNLASLESGIYLFCIFSELHSKQLKLIILK